MKIARPTYLSPEWHTQRKRDETGKVRFGASDAPVLMNLSKYRNIVDLFISRQSDELPEPPNDVQMRGHLLEPALLQYASNLLEEQIETPDPWFTAGRFVATLDGLTKDELVIVEAKSTMQYSSDDKIPESFYWQVQAQLACVPTATYAMVVVLDKRMRFGYWQVFRNEADIARLLDWAEIVGTYFDNNELPPDVLMTEHQIKTFYPDPVGELEIGERGFELVQQYKHIKSIREDMDKQEQDLRNEIVNLLGNKEIGTVNGVKVISYKSRKGSLRLDAKLLEAENPELVANYRRIGATTRTLRTH